MKKSEIDRILGRPIEAAEREQEKAKDNEAGAFGKIGATVLELLVGAPTKGAIKSIEGIYDAHVGAIGAIGGAFDEDFKENLGKHIAFDATGWLSDAIGYDKVEDASFLDDGKVGNFVRDVEQGIGGMAPSVALSAIPYAGAVLGPVSMGMAAGGNNMESALQNDAGYYNAWLYGVGSGVVEGATEAIGGFALGKSSTLVSKMLSGTKLGKAASSGLGKVAETFISEAGEEMASDLADPALKYATGVDKNIGENYKETIKGLPRTALLGGTIGSIMGGGSTALGGVRNSSRGGFKASRADNSMEYISKVSKYYDKDISKHAKYDKAIDDALYDISRELTAMSKEQRANYMSTMGLYKNAFNEDGSIKSDLRADINTGAVSSNLRAISATLKHKPLSADTELTDGASKAKSYVEKMLGEGANVVVTSDSAQNNAFYNVDEGIVYINNNAAFSREEIAEFVATHEVAHITEGTRAYRELELALEEISKDPKAPAALKAKIGDVAQRQIEIGERYKSQMKNMSPEQQAYLIRTELNADLVGILLGDEYFIEKLAQRDASLVEKIFNKLKALAKRDTSSTTSGPPSPTGEGIKKSASVDRESARYLSKLVNKFGRAINKSQGGVKISQLGREDEEKGAEVDEVRYSKTGSNGEFSKADLETIKQSISDVVDVAVSNKGKINEKYNQKQLSEVPDSLSQMIALATDGEIDISKKIVAIHGDYLWHEFDRHTKESDEQARHQIAFTKEQFKEAIVAIYSPDMVECVFATSDNPTQQRSFAYAKKSDNGYYVAVEVVGGKRNPNIVPIMILQFDEIKWKDMIDSGKTLGELFYENDEELKNVLDIDFNKKNRVTAAQFASSEAIANTLRSPRSNNSISENGEKINTFGKKIDDERKSISKSVDSEGNSLSAEQAEYFKDSKVRDENGNLLVVYHGSDAVFNEFKHRYINTHGSQEGRGFYFTDSVNMARGYKKGEGQLLKGYVNISKPLSDTALTLTRKEVASLIKAIDPTGDDLIANYDTGGGMGYPSRTWYNRAFNDTLDAVMNYCDTDSEVLAELRNAGADEEKLLKTVRRTLGYDGYITSEKYENAQIFVAFESNQFKNADNTAPTDNPDIRYSKSKGERFTVGRETEMRLAEELVKGYEEGALSSEEALRKLNALGYKTGINTDNALERLEELIPEIREYATSEREAYRESNRKDTSSTTSGPPSPQVEGYEGAITEEDANRQAQDSLDYWVKNGDQFYGSVKYLKNGKVKVKLAQTANEVRLAKFINNNIMGKAYTNQDVKSIIDKVLTNSNIWGADDSGSYMAKLKGEDLSAVKKQLWAALNTAPEGERIGPALDIADYIVKHGILTEIVEVTEDVYYAQSIIDTLEPYKRKIDISHIKSDIEAKFDTDRAPFGLWEQKKSDTSRGFTADEVGQALEEAGIVLSGDRGKLINEADIFVAMHELYTMAQSIIKNAAPAKNDIVGAYDAKEIHELKQKIASEIMSSYEQYGKETAFSKVEKKYRGEISSLKKRVKDVHEENRLKNAVLYEAQKIKDSKAGKYHNATQVQDDSLKALKALLGKIKYRSDLNRSSVRKIINELARWYTEDNPVLQSFAVDKQTSESRGLYSPHIKALIDLFLVEDADATSSAEKPLDTTELGALNQILHHMNFVFESYGKIWRGGRWVDAPEIAKGQIAVLQEARANETVVGKLLKQGYFNFFMDPELVCARLDGADKNGYFTTLLEDLRQADIKQRHDEMLALERYDEFEKKHKKYITALMSEKNTVKVGNVIDPHAEGGATAEILEIPRYAAIDLYMVSKTRGALETFEETGWRLRLDSSKGKLDTPKATITEAQIKGIEKQFTREDLELIEIMEEQYNVNLRRLKYETDMIRLGMSNVFDGYYYPINRISANNLDSNDFFFDLERVSNSSFNNSRVKGARNAIIVSNALTKFKKHVNGVTRYANLSIPIENMTKLLNIDVGNNANMPQSITMLLRETKDGLDAEKYIKTLIKDVQQVNIQTDGATKVVSYLRGAYAKSTLGFNPKVLFTQASSYIAGFGELRASSLAYGVAHIAKLKGLDGELDKYCPWAAVRHYEKGATRAMTVTDKISKAGDFFTMGIEFMDRQIVKLEFLACQHEARVRYHLEIGTEENKIKAGELLMELGLKTQQNQLTTEKSAAMRSENELAKTLTMFKADSMKQISRFLQTINAMSVLKKKMQAARSVGDTSKYSMLEAEYKRAQKSFCKYSAVIIVSSVYMVMLARLFNKLYGREEEDENKVLGFFEDLFGNICGMIPIISELYAFFVDGYEVDSFLYSTLNNTMDAVKGTAEVVGGLVSGKNVSQEEINTSIRKLVYSIGALAGLPAKNMYKNTKAVIDLVSPSTGDKIDAWFKAPSEKSLEENIKASIEKGNDKAVSSSLGLLYDKYDLKLEDAVLRREYDRLMRLEMAKAEDDSAKYSPLEAKIPSNLTVDGEEVELLKKDVNTFKNAFLVAEKSQASVVKTAPYKKLKDEERAYALRKISQFYYEETKYSYTGEKSNFTYYAKVVGIEDLALILAYAKNLKGDARQSRREKIEAYIKGLGLNAVKTSLALRCLGYSDKDNDELVKGYVGRASLLSKEERAELLKILE